MELLFRAPSPQLPPAAADPALLASRAPNASPQAVAEVARNFESLFASQLLKEMRQTLEPDTFFAGDSGDVWGGLFDMYLGQHLAQSNALGIAELVKRQLQGQPQAPPPAGGIWREQGTAPVTAEGGATLDAQVP